MSGKLTSITEQTHLEPSRKIETYINTQQTTNYNQHNSLTRNHPQIRCQKTVVSRPVFQTFSMLLTPKHMNG